MPDSRQNSAAGLARGLGWFSLALGTAQVAAPRAVNRLIGARPTQGSNALMRAVGARELAAAAGLLARPQPPAFLWARAAGDAMDLGLLAGARRHPSDKRRVGMAAGAVAGVAVLDVLAAARRSRRREALEARSAVTVNAPPEKAYAAWRDLESLPGFMYHLESVTVTGDRRSHWVAKAPAGTTVEWDAQITDDVPGKRIAWRSLEGAVVENSGSVRFQPAPGGQGTEVHVELRYSPPGGAVGKVVAQLFGEEPNQQVGDDMRRFKQLVETGEIARTDGSPLGSRTRNQLSQEDAQPATEAPANGQRPTQEARA